MTQKSHSTPLANSYWVLPGHLLAGEYPGSPYQEESRRKLGQFLDHGVDAFLDLTQKGELMPYAEILDELGAARGAEVAYRRMSVRDMGVPTRPQIAEIIGQLESWIGDGRTVYDVQPDMLVHTSANVCPIMVVGLRRSLARVYVPSRVIICRKGATLCSMPERFWSTWP